MAYKHWRNYDEPGKTGYVTCTCLDFAHLLHRNEMKRSMALHILRAFKHHEARLHAFVVMSHHIHFLITPNENQTISEFMSSFKTHTSKEMTPLLNQYELSQLRQQIGLSWRTFWKVSFRGFPINTKDTFWQKVRYIHLNPVGSGKAPVPEDYPWSSGPLYAKGLYHESRGLRIGEPIQFYEDLGV